MIDKLTLKQYYAAHAPDFNMSMFGRPEDQIGEIVRLRWLYANEMLKQGSIDDSKTSSSVT